MDTKELVIVVDLVVNTTSSSHGASAKITYIVRYTLIIKPLQKSRNFSP